MVNNFMRGFWKLTWVETKIFIREPMGFVGTLVMPVVLFVAMGKLLGDIQPAGVASQGLRTAAGAMPVSAPIDTPVDTPFNVAIFAAVVIAFNGVQSLVAIISVYREGGILKRLRATPLSPVTILGAHVVVKLCLTVVSLALLVAAGRRLFSGAMEINTVSFGAALLLSTLSILSLGFVIASLVPTARFAQPISALLLYPMLALSGIFFPVDRLPAALKAFGKVLPTTHAVALLQGVWNGAGWGAHGINALMLVVLFVAYSAFSTKVFRWE